MHVKRFINRLVDANGNISTRNFRSLLDVTEMTER